MLNDRVYFSHKPDQSWVLEDVEKFIRRGQWIRLPSVDAYKRALVDTSVSVGDRFNGGSSTFEISEASGDLFTVSNGMRAPRGLIESNIRGGLWTRLPRTDTPQAASKQENEQ